MSLDTVLKIGKALRESKDNLKNFKYVNPLPKDKKGNYLPTCLSIPVKEDFSIDWNSLSFVRENEQPSLFYLKFKTSDNDSSMKYVFGDIYYAKVSKIKKDGSIEKKEGGYYRLGSPNGKQAQQKSSFERGQADFEDIVKNYKGSILKRFRNSLANNLDVLAIILDNISAVEGFLFDTPETTFLEFLYDELALSKAAIKRIHNKTSKQILNKLGIESTFTDLTDSEKEKLLKFDHGDIFIHFDFPENLHWHQYKEELKLITDKMLSDFVEKYPNGLVLKKTLYKTLCSGDKKNDWQFPDFSIANKHKSKAFTNDEIQDLFYAIDYSSKGKLISGTDIKIILLPRGKNLKAEHFEEFRKKRDEDRIKKSNESKRNDEEPLFDFFEKDKEEHVTSFDVIFCIDGGKMPDVDLLEISGIEKSKIRITRKRLKGISIEIAKKRKSFLMTDKYLFPFKLEYSFKNILGNPQFDQKTNKITFKVNSKYKSHILKVLPLIYTDNYHHDDILLPAFIQNIEYSIRSGDNKFNLLKFDLEYLYKIQKSSTNKFDIMINTKSYQIGKQLGQLAKPLRKAINSFEKSYVGLITRRVATKYDCVKFANEITEKLTRHGKRWAEQTASIVAELSVIPEAEYDKELVAFGFLGGYFTYEEQSADTKKFYARLEKLLNDFEGNEELQHVIENISSISTSNQPE